MLRLDSPISVRTMSILRTSRFKTLLAGKISIAMPGAPELGLGLGNKSVEEGRRWRVRGNLSRASPLQLRVRRTEEPTTYL
ncbi:hypothetical protein M6B38_374440 [Iris pallida]|uniref:Uncharacterized protein n=1 Tax=Iris pallida TaxID=29817 RepID=A0AAX6GCP9_IRIPA|nr:hypothetical protein M6B38_374440 [Iris pallida]